MKRNMTDYFCTIRSHRFNGHQEGGKRKRAQFMHAEEKEGELTISCLLNLLSGIQHLHIERTKDTCSY